MIPLGSIRQRQCNGITRRAVLEVGGLGALGFGLSDWFAAKSAAGAESAKPNKSVILLWMWGGPPHMDTFDPKPEAPAEYRGPFGTVPTKIPGVRFGELFGKLADRTDDLCIIRSLQSKSNDHGVAATVGLTGSKSGGVGLGGPTGGNPRASSGSILARIRGFRPDRPPPYVVVGPRLHQGKKLVTGEGAGSLGAGFEPFRCRVSPERGVELPALQLPKEVSKDRMARRQGLLGEMDRTQAKMEGSRAVEDFDQYGKAAFALLTSPAAKAAFDLDAEPESVRSRYGYTRFGRSCLLARRLVERGVGFVTVNWSQHVEDEQDSGDGGWDLHGRTFDWLMDGNAAIFDTAMSALLDDLKSRGLLDTTLVAAYGEFGRTPKINDQAGREHWEHCYSALLAGGGIRGGRTVGHSDKLGQYPVDRPVPVGDLCSTILQGAGIGASELAIAGIQPPGEIMQDLFV